MLQTDAWAVIRFKADNPDESYTIHISLKHKLTLSHESGLCTVT